MIDTKDDKSNSPIWLASFDGKSERRITSSTDSESGPRRSPDRQSVAFTSSRPGPAKGSQVWVMDSNGGDAIQLTDA